jgi:hypothetical protein
MDILYVIMKNLRVAEYCPGQRNQVKKLILQEKRNFIIYLHLSSHFRRITLYADIPGTSENQEKNAFAE